MLLLGESTRLEAATVSGHREARRWAMRPMLAPLALLLVGSAEPKKYGAGVYNDTQRAAPFYAQLPVACNLTGRGGWLLLFFETIESPLKHWNWLWLCAAGLSHGTVLSATISLALLEECNPDASNIVAAYSPRDICHQPFSSRAPGSAVSTSPLRTLSSPI